MRKAWIVAFVIAGGVSVAGTVMSQGAPAEDAKRTVRVSNDDVRERQVRNELVNILQQAKDKLRRLNAPAARDLDLMLALNAYILENQFDAVIKHLEEIIVASPETASSARAQTAIRVLRGEDLTSIVTPADGAIVPQQRTKEIQPDTDDRP